MPAPAPSRLREWRANEVVVLERNDNYYGEKAKLARVIYRHVKESATQRLMLEKGDIDVARNLQPGDFDAVAKNADLASTSDAEGHGLLLQPQPEEPEPGQAGSARGVQISGRLRRARRDADQGHRRDPPELPAQGRPRRARRQALQARRRQGQGTARQGRPAGRLHRHHGRAQRPAGDRASPSRSSRRRRRPASRSRSSRATASRR